jgi:hypothetical protein
MTGAMALIDVKQSGKTIPAIAAINKPGLLFAGSRKGCRWVVHICRLRVTGCACGFREIMAE